MKFIHCADIHLGSSLDSVPKDKVRQRKSEILSAFIKMVDYAKSNEIGVVVLSGDVFDNVSPLTRDKSLFYSVINNNPDIKFMYLKGNHDNAESDSIPNLFTFGEEPVKYEIDDVCFCGVELSQSNHLSFHNALSFEEDKKNVLILHGALSSVAAMDSIKQSALKNKGIDYLALGHIHKYYEGRLDERGIYVNPGCLEGRGFDECGEKGFVVVNTEDFSHEFIVNSIRVIREIEVDVSAAENAYGAIEIVRNAFVYPQSDIVKLVLKGDVTFDNEDLASLIRTNVEDKSFYVTVNNNTLRRIDPQEYAGDLSLRGEFVRVALADDALSEEEKNKVINIGLKLLSGQDI